jgi:phage pi2 protein 07
MITLEVSISEQTILDPRYEFEDLIKSLQHFWGIIRMSLKTKDREKSLFLQMKLLV